MAAIKIKKKVLKTNLKSCNKYMDNAIKLIGSTNSTNSDTLIYKIEALNKEFHDTESVKKAYDNVNKALSELQNEMVNIDIYMQTLQSYYDTVVRLQSK